MLEDHMNSFNHGCHRWEQIKYSILEIQNWLSFATEYVVLLFKNMANQIKRFCSLFNIKYYYISELILKIFALIISK
jgi:hypothetical protein